MRASFEYIRKKLQSFYAYIPSSIVIISTPNIVIFLTISSSVPVLWHPYFKILVHILIWKSISKDIVTIRINALWLASFATSLAGGLDACDKSRWFGLPWNVLDYWLNLSQRICLEAIHNGQHFHKCTNRMLGGRGYSKCTILIGNTCWHAELSVSF